MKESITVFTISSQKSSKWAHEFGAAQKRPISLLEPVSKNWSYKRPFCPIFQDGIFAHLMTWGQFTEWTFLTKKCFVCALAHLSAIGLVHEFFRRTNVAPFSSVKPICLFSIEEKAVYYKKKFRGTYADSFVIINLMKYLTLHYLSREVWVARFLVHKTFFVPSFEKATRRGKISDQQNTLRYLLRNVYIYTTYSCVMR